jgi:hypothetical protein
VVVVVTIAESAGGFPERKDQACRAVERCGAVRCGEAAARCGSQALVVVNVTGIQEKRILLVVVRSV